MERSDCVKNPLPRHRLDSYLMEKGKKRSKANCPEAAVHLQLASKLNKYPKFNIRSANVIQLVLITVFRFSVPRRIRIISDKL